MLSSSWQFVLWWWLFPPWHLVSWTALLEQMRADVPCWESWALCWCRILMKFCHWSSSETHGGRSHIAVRPCQCTGAVWERRCVQCCWCKAMLCWAVWGLCWKSLAPLRQSTSLPSLSTLENWLPLGACLWLWRLLRAGAPFQRSVLVWVFWCFGLVFLLLFVCLLLFIFPVSIVLVVFGPTLTRSFQSWDDPTYELSPWAGSGMTAWGKRDIAACHLGHKESLLASLILAVSKTKRDWYKLLTRGVMKRFILWLQSRWANS